MNIKLLTLLILISSQVFAKDKYTTFKNIKSKLSPKQGFLAIVIDNTSGVEFYKLKLQKTDSLISGHTFKKLSKNKLYALIKLDKGTYFWSKGSLRDQSYFKSKDKKNAKFEIKPQVINYFGDLIIQYNPKARTFFLNYQNRMSQMYLKLKKESPHAFSKYPLVLSSQYPDPFAEFYQNL